MTRRALVFLTFVSLGLVAGLVLTGRMRTAEVGSAAPADAAPPAEAAPQSTGDRPPAAAALPDLTAIAHRAIDSVTNISSTRVVRSPMLTNDPFFNFFFGEDLYRERRQQSLGSGVVVSADGYILTNRHVVGSAAAEVRVGLADKREFAARVVGDDEWTDLAVLKVEAASLPTLAWGDSAQLRVAEWVLAIGNPFQLNQTVTLGIVSATNRRLQGRVATYEDFIQTDAAINPGNSGGALINARGELVGINTAIYSQSGGYQGIGFAVPSNLARQVMDEILKHGAVRRGTIPGIQVRDMTPEIAAELGAPDPRGVLVLSVLSRADAYARGLRQYDIITAFNGTPIEDTAQLVRVLAETEIGSTATLRVVRQGRARDLRITVEEASATRTRL